MNEAEYRRMFAAEDEGWWFRARRAIVRDVIDSWALPESPTVAAIGCGTGGNLAMLAELGEVTGVEPSPVAAEAARSRKVARIVSGTASATGLPDASQDLVVMLDVLEHLDDEAGALAEVRRILRPGGLYVMTVPAFMALWSAHDEALHHRRRYRRRQLLDVLEAADLPAAYCTYFNAGLFLPVAAVRIGRRLLRIRSEGADGAEDLPGPVSRTLEGVFEAERHLLARRTQLPFGVSLLAVCRAHGARGLSG